MSIEAADIVSESYRLLGRPAQADLPYQDVLDTAKDVIRGYLVDMKLSARNHTPQIGAWVTPNDREMTTAGFAGGIFNFIPVRVEWRYLWADDSTTTPMRAEVVSFEQLSDMYRLSTQTETFCAFYNGNQSIAFSETPETLAQREYRLIYESMEDLSLALNKNVELPALFVTLCKYETALNCLDQVINTSETWIEKRERMRKTLLMNVGEWREKFSKWRTSAFGQKKVTKLGYRPRLRSI